MNITANNCLLVYIFFLTTGIHKLCTQETSVIKIRKVHTLHIIRLAISVSTVNGEVGEGKKIQSAYLPHFPKKGKL